MARSSEIVVVIAALSAEHRIMLGSATPVL